MSKQKRHCVGHSDNRITIQQISQRAIIVFVSDILVCLTCSSSTSHAASLTARDVWTGRQVRAGFFTSLFPRACIFMFQHNVTHFKQINVIVRRDQLSPPNDLKSPTNCFNFPRWAGAPEKTVLFKRRSLKLPQDTGDGVTGSGMTFSAVPLLDVVVSWRVCHTACFISPPSPSEKPACNFESQKQWYCPPLPLTSNSRLVTND